MWIWRVEQKNKKKAQEKEHPPPFKSCARPLGTNKTTQYYERGANALTWGQGYYIKLGETNEAIRWRN